MSTAKERRRKPSSSSLAKERAAVRQRFQAERPTPAELLASGDVDGFVPLGEFLEFQEAVQELKRCRRRARLSLATVAARSNIDKAVLQRLEEGLHTKLTLDILRQYADAVGAEVSFRVVAKPASEGNGEGI